MIKEYRKAGVPLVALECADPAAVLETVKREVVNGTTPPVLVWDCIRGIRAANKEAEELAAALNQNQDPAIATGNPVEALRALQGLPEKSVCVMFGLALIWSDPQSATPAKQAAWNLRDELKGAGALVIATVPLGYKLPPELAGDFVSAVVPLPTDTEHAASVVSLCGDAGIEKPDEATTARAVEAVAGLSAFAAEQATALSITKAGIDTAALWERKRRAIEQTRGLSVWRGADNFAKLGGLDNAKALFSRVIAGKRRPRIVVWIDEVEKAFAGSASDSSGVSQGFLGTTLSEMEDNQYTGAILYGHPGTGKSAIAKAIAGEIGCPCIRFDLGAMKGGLVGESEASIRAAWQVVRAIGGFGGALVLATCNGMQGLPAEFIARFRLGTLFFDLPTKAEQETIWKIWRAKYGISELDEEPDCAGWVGREIAACCDMADRLSTSLEEAAQFIVPIGRSSANVIKARREDASGRYLSASKPGIYSATETKADAPKMTRVLTLGGN